MPRQLRDNPPPAPPEPQRLTLHVTLETITPMFGGNAQPRYVDPGYPIRPASVRGHLRFWWRATQSVNLSAQELFEREEKLFGSDQKHGCVQLAVTVLRAGKQKRASDYSGSKATGPRESYFLFPFREEKYGGDGVDALEDVQFEIEVCLDPRAAQDALAQVRRALQAWIAFGGIGARTRRGCGALRAVGDTAAQFTLRADQLKDFFAEDSTGFPTKERPSFTSLRGARLLHTGVSTGSAAGLQLWRNLGTFWAKFHKGHYAHNYNPTGGSAWRDHSTLVSGPSAGTMALVKPYLGLPVVYNSFRGTAFGGTIHAVRPQARDDRFASPVILKPIAVEGGLVGAVLILNGPEPTQIRVSTWPQAVRLTIDPSDPVLRELGATSALDAVAKAAQRDGYSTEVLL